MKRQPEYTFRSLREAERYVIEAYFIDCEVQDYTLTYKDASDKFSTITSKDLMRCINRKALNMYLHHKPQENT